VTKKERFIQFIKFCFWGVLTTLINLASYALSRFFHIPVTAATIIAWFFSVLFAFATNRKYVFDSKSRTWEDILKECALFYGSRVFSGVIDVLFMFLTVNILKLNEIYCKVADEFFVSILNYILSIIVVFNNKKKSGEKSL